MGWFHALSAGTDVPDTVFHICPKSHWKDNNSTYFPKAYDEDKFTRATHRPEKLLETANCFYKDDKDMDWICLQINTQGLAFNSIEITMETSEMDPELKCPHIFGGLPRECVTKVYPVERSGDGTFLVVKGLTDTCCARK